MEPVIYDYLESKFESIEEWLQGSYLNNATTVITRQLMQDALREADDAFGSDMLGRYYPYVCDTDDGGAVLAFTDKDSVTPADIELLSFEELEPYSWCLPKVVAAGDEWPYTTEAKATIPQPAQRRERGSRHDRRRRGS